MNDLLQKTYSGGRGYLNMRDVEKLGGEMEMQGIDPEKNLASFFDEVNVIKTDMERIKSLLAKLQDSNEESKTIHKVQAMKALRDRMDKDLAEVSKVARSVKQKLEELDKANAASRRTKGCEEGTPTDRTRSSITNSLTKKLKDLMESFGTLRSKIMVEYRETIERRYYTVTGQKPDEETLEQIIDTGESENFLQKAIQEQGRGQIIETIKEIQERHDGVKEIEKSLLELHQIFLDLAVLVESQGTVLDNIESQVNRAHSYVEKAGAHLTVAKKHQRNTRKWTCIAIIIVLIIILVIVVPIATSLKK
ncbi:syntaxin 1B/2/3 [Marchantia polymorpha subsp. ruderalis]|uniref:t-SNARE coiled-coil homology domain-containing protein n=2 Tax=Marchantia polymorpha TaxID=3197 RepID=A0AAF6BLX3_MARPO|nr:hypothetical protein MARPO_0163s0015 [Marchantia polymorpha]BAS01257.1 syntaxin of plant 12A [Marchantia polymorpha]BBN13007.1 hypothetical protein Mp_6g00050 [Marchantia polymorpha subsp. ruderalis]|eukprot:PTQ28460.1 hypothetical protein MARPO_0163s0015 [Marchantia polymorpha]